MTKLDKLRQQPTYQSFQQGFALLEVIITALILAVGLASLAKLGSAMQRDIVLAKQRAEAIYYAQDRIEQYHGYLYIITTAGVLDYNDIVSGNDTITGTNATFTRTWTVTTNTNPDFKTISVTVSWRNPVSGTAETVQMTSIISKIDPAASGKAMYS